jgi:hypothetical protein
MANELLADILNRNLEMLKMTLADFSETEMLVRPVPGANHAAWQLGHLIASEAGMVNLCKPGAIPELPAGFIEKFKPETSKVDDSQAFASKAQLLDLYARVRAASINWVKSLTTADMNQPGPERIKGFCPTVGHVAELLANHVAMHLGQLQVIRRKLGKPILF